MKRVHSSIFASFLCLRSRGGNAAKLSEERRDRNAIYTKKAAAYTPEKLRKAPRGGWGAPRALVYTAETADICITGEGGGSE